MVNTKKYFISHWSRIFLAPSLVDRRGEDTIEKKALRIQKVKLLRILGCRKIVPNSTSTSNEVKGKTTNQAVV